MQQHKRIDKSVLAVGIVGSLVLANVIGLALFGRLDLTADKAFTLGAATKTVLAELKEPVTVRAYFTKDMPPPYSTNARYVKDLLDEYFTHGHGNFRYEFIDPMSEETDADKEKKKDVKQDIFGRAVREATSVERELQGLGIPPVQVRVNEADKLEVKRAYMGLAIVFGDKKEVIPVVRETAGLEYDLTTLVRKMTREKTPKVALVGGHDGLDPEKAMARVWGLLGQVYQTSTIDLTKQAEVPDDIDALLIVGPKTPFSAAEKHAIDGFVMKGKGVAFLLDAIRPDLQTLQSEDMNHGLGDLLAAYGVVIKPGLVLDSRCATLNVTQQRGFMRIMQPVQYPFVPLPEGLDPQHPLTRGLAQVAFPFMSPLELSPASEGVKVETLVKSSPRAWVQEPPYNLDPMQRWTQEMVKDEGTKALVVSVSGALKSYAGGDAKATNGRILVAGGSSFLSDQFMGKGTEAFGMNLVDWLVLDEALLAMRARGLNAAPLAEMGDGARNTIKYVNILGLPMAFIGFGLVRWRLREKRRRDLAA